MVFEGPIPEFEIEGRKIPTRRFIKRSILLFLCDLERKIMELKYIVTETKGPDSFDPVNADKTQNLSVMRMLYATPIEVDRNNGLQSKILSSFEYLRDKDQIVFDVKTDQKYSDGTVLTPEDVALAIARMAYYRPQFPVIKDIQNVKEWAESKRGLETYPSGIKIEGNKIVIKLTRKSANPLFRFCLELFSVIPSRCIDKKTAALACELAPSSGYFTLASKTPDKIIFKKRHNETTIDPIQFEKIEFQFKSLSESCQTELKSNEVVSGIEIDYLSSGCNHSLSSSQIHWMPSARFAILRFNPHIAPFDDQDHRHLFAEVTREILKIKYKSLLVERGLFTKILPGYIPSDQLARTFDESLKNSFKGMKITLPLMRQSGFKLVFDCVIEAARELGMEVSLIEDPSLDTVLKGFLKGEIPVAVGASGFWAQDPIGDVAMWFTPNLHPNMVFTWKDKKMYEQIESLEVSPDPAQVQIKMEKLNRHISEEALLAPVLHYRRLFISSKDVMGLHLPQAVTSPAPWQLIPVE